MTARKKILWSALALVLLAGVAAFIHLRPESVDTRYTGAYALPDDSFVFIAPNGGTQLRFRTLSGQSGALWPAGSHRFTGGRGWAEREPVANSMQFEMDANDRPVALSWTQSDSSMIRAPRVSLPEQIATFESGNIKLRAKLVLPEDSSVHPAVVLVHGSEKWSAVDGYFEPYLYAARGFAALVFDKRGTGGSEGEYTQNFRVLAGDVLAAVKWLRDQPGIDPDRIHLAGFSQGGWIAPLAAARDGNIRSVLVGFGPVVSVFDEDRWGYVNALRQRGFDEAAIASADRVNAVISDIVDRHQDRWDELARMLEESRGQAWFDAVKGSDSMLGHVAGMKAPTWVMRAYADWQLRPRDGKPYIDRLYDPVPVLAALKSPSFWIFAGQDASMPTDWTIEALNKLQKRGKPVDYMVYPDADHGILRIQQSPEGERRVLGYEPDYFKVQIDWLRRHST